MSRAFIVLIKAKTGIKEPDCTNSCLAGDGGGGEGEKKREGMTRTSNDCLSRRLTLTPSFSGFSFSLDEGNRGMGGVESGEENGTKENENGMRRPRHVFAGACRNFPFRKRTVYSVVAGEGWRRRLLQRHVSSLTSAHEALAPGIYSRSGKSTRVCVCVLSIVE